MSHQEILEVHGTFYPKGSIFTHPLDWNGHYNSRLSWGKTREQELMEKFSSLLLIDPDPTWRQRTEDFLKSDHQKKEEWEKYYSNIYNKLSMVLDDEKTITESGAKLSEIPTEEVFELVREDRESGIFYSQGHSFKVLQSFYHFEWSVISQGYRDSSRDNMYSEIEGDGDLGNDEQFLKDVLDYAKQFLQSGKRLPNLSKEVEFCFHLLFQFDYTKCGSYDAEEIDMSYEIQGIVNWSSIKTLPGTPHETR